MRREPRPCSAIEAVERALRYVGQGTYVYGTGDFRPRFIGGRHVDRPWTTRDGREGSDCAGLAICYAYMLQRHRPGFAPGHHPLVDWDIDDDINCNSAIEDAHTERDLFEVITRPELGALLVFPTFKVAARAQPFIGHCAIVVSVDRCLEWNPLEPDYARLDVVQCRGPTGRSPGVIRTDGALWDRHDENWPRPEHRAVMLRALP